MADAPNPAAEFDDGLEPETPVTPPATPPAVPNAEVSALRETVSSLKEELEGMRGNADIVNKLKDVFGGGQKQLNPRDQWVREELFRVMPELASIPKITQILPSMAEALGAAAEERVHEKASAAQEVTRSLMKGDGLDPKDEDAFGYMEEALAREIKANPELTKRWARGDVKGAVNAAYEKVSSKLLAPVRRNTKRSAVQVIADSPRAPRGGSPTPAGGGEKKIDYSDTSRQNTRSIHDAAFDRLLEHQDR